MTGRNNNAFIVPKRAFEDNEKKAIFLKNAQNWHKIANA